MSAGARADALRTTRLPAIPDAHGFAGAFAGIVGHELLAGGGANFPDGVMPWNGGTKIWHDTLYSLDLSVPGSRWKVVGKLPRPNGYGVSLTTPDGVVIIGGGNADGHFKEVWLLHLSDEGHPEFRPLPPLPHALAQMCGALAGRRIHLCGGIANPDDTRASNAHLMLDLDALDAGWQSLPALPADGRILAAAAAVDGTFFVMGGCSLAADASGKPARTYLGDSWRFADGRWSRTAGLPHPLAACASPAPVSGGGVFLVSGDDGGQAALARREDHKGFSKVVLRYDITGNAWEPAGELTVPPPVTVAVTRWKKGFVFVNGEVKPGVRTPDVFVLTLPEHE